MSAPVEWRKSSFSGGGGENCVEVAQGQDGSVALRESDEPGTVITTTRGKLAAFILGVKAGEFDHFVS
ncbi:DUF397 domain-containing protein [Streptomyces palmae]|uniref:DUF397 domain-containing protein n=1 Tax=Streptomyces palmae TaxID=1701085 RepID=A0A4Z0HCM4_9ACTN|nr:DUF397 domain-containing protein [Streptomyces palmae]TGB11561.1 DUF397 domain-containing protein [Streptomyces palmae]